MFINLSEEEKENKFQELRKSDTRVQDSGTLSMWAGILKNWQMRIWKI